MLPAGTSVRLNQFFRLTSEFTELEANFVYNVRQMRPQRARFRFKDRLSAVPIVVLLLAGLWVLSAADGQQSNADPSNAEQSNGDQPPVADLELGGRVYSGHGCSGCHGDEGGGGAGPPLAGNPKLWNQTYVMDQIIRGGGGMPAFGRQLSDQQIAAVASYIRSSWGNDMPPLSSSEVKQRLAAVNENEEERPSGAQIFAWNCMICHGVEGGGGVGPALAGNRHLTDANFTVAQIQLGGGGMPPFAPILDSAEIAAVASYIRTAWQNDFGEVPTEHVQVQWEGLAGTGDVGSNGSRSEEGPDQAADGGNADGGDESSSAEGEEGGGGADDAGSASGESGDSSAGTKSPGARLFGSIGCAGCHSSEGAGGIGPPLDGNPVLRDADLVVDTIRDGRKGMPAFGEILDEASIVLLANYVRNAWSNEYGKVEQPQHTNLPASLLRSQADPAPMAPLAEAGQQLFSAVGCAGCHSSEGAGGIGPPLDGNQSLSDSRHVVNTVLTGQEQMPPFAHILTDQQIAAVATYVRTAWTNEFGSVATDFVTRLRHDQPETR